MRLRRLTAVLLLAVFVLAAVSGFMVHLAAHAGRDAVVTPGGGVSAPPADDSHLRRGHELAGYLLIVLGLLHLSVNGRAMLAHLGLRGKGGPGR